MVWSLNVLSVLFAVFWVSKEKNVAEEKQALRDCTSPPLVADSTPPVLYLGIFKSRGVTF